MKNIVTNDSVRTNTTTATTRGTDDILIQAGLNGVALKTNGNLIYVDLGNGKQEWILEDYLDKV